MTSRHSPQFCKALLAFLLLITWGLVGCTSKTVPQVVLPEPETVRLAERAQRVEIIRDDFGVPHIYAKTDADAVFGMLYAQAEDDFARIERNYIWATGRLAEVEGEKAIYSDVRARLYMSEAEAKAAYASAPDWLKELCNAFADGLNYYLMTHPEVEPALFTRFEPWMPMFFSEGSIGGDIEQIPLAGIEAFYGQKQDAPPVSNVQLGEPSGSNGFAIAGKHTQSGNAMLLINPHTSFYFRGEIHVVSEQGLNAYGAVTWGQFFVYQGFNENNGWMHTSTYADFIDEFVEEVFEQQGKLYYRYGNEVREVSQTELVLDYKTEQGMQQRPFTLYHTHHGPVTHMQDGKWVVTKINWDPVNALTQSFRRTKTSNLSEFNEMMKIRTNSSNNTVYADKQGNIAYYHGNFIPKRSTEFDYSKPVDGSNPATDWQGKHALDETITLFNPDNGWIQNANSTPFTAAADFSPKASDYPKYMAPDAENFRGIHAVQVLSQRTGYDLDGLIEAAYDPYLPAFAVLIPGLIDAFDSAGENFQHLKAPVNILRNWDYRVSADSIAMTLAHFYGMAYLEKGAKPNGFSQMQRIQMYGTSTPYFERLDIFDQVVAMLEQDFAQWQTPWWQVNRFQRLSGDIDLQFDDSKPSIPVAMASGRWGALAAFGAKRTDTKRLYGYRGNSFVAVVEFGKKVRAKSLLAGGQSSDPASPHFDDQAQRYADVEFKTVPYYREDVEKRAKRKYYPGQSAIMNQAQPLTEMTEQ